jgi:hypothetical protein
MRLDIEPEIFASDERVALIKLLDLAVEGQHDWRPTLSVAFQADELAHDLPPEQVEFIQKTLKQAANPVPPAPAVAIVTVGNLRVMLADLSKPARLVVENELGDGGFVRAMAAALGDERVVEAVDRLWLEFGNGGGYGQIPELAAKACKRFVLVVRVGALFDSDREIPRQRSPRHDSFEKARAVGVPELHMFTWRMVENYVPFRVWERHFPAKQELIDMLRAMLPDKRGYLNLKKQFGQRSMPKPQELIPEGIVLSEEDFAELGPDVVPELRELLAKIHRIL